MKRTIRVNIILIPAYLPKIQRGLGSGTNKELWFIDIPFFRIAIDTSGNSPHLRRNTLGIFVRSWGGDGDGNQLYWKTF